MKRGILLMLMLWALSFGVHAQMGLQPFLASAGGFSSTALSDYQCLSVNPANLAYVGDNKFHIGISDLSFGFYSEPLTRKELFNDMLAEDIVFSMAEKEDAAHRFTNSRFLFTGTANWLGVSWQHEKVGGFAFNVRERIHVNLILNQFAAEMLFLGWNADYFDQMIENEQGEIIRGVATDPRSIAELGVGCEANCVWLREYQFGYGRSLVKNDGFTLNAGFSARYIHGFVFGQYYTTDDGTDIYGKMAVTPLLRADKGESPLSPVEGTGLEPVGSGFGMDVALSGMVGKRIKWGVTLGDIGKVRWFGNVFQGQNWYFDDIDFGGMNSFNVFKEGPDIEAISGHDFENIVPLEHKLPMHLRAGGSFAMSSLVEVGAEIYMPLLKQVPGAYDGPVVSLGGAIHKGIINFYGGLNFNNYYGLRLPLSLVMKLGKKSHWELGFGVPDVVGAVRQNNPNIGLAVGMVRLSL